MNHQCVLCFDEVPYIGITECNHGPFCFRCIYKMRVISKNNSCPICKTESKQVVISENYTKFGEFSGDVLPDKLYSDVFYTSESAKRQFQKLTEYKCFIKIGGKPCKHDKKFPNIAFLKKHMKEDHKRSFCDVCLQKKTCILEEQKLYNQAQLTRHLQRGDLDECGNIVFMHPYCGFCKQYFFDDEQFRVHLGLEHMNCHVCGKHQKYRFYKNYDSLEIHYKISHYICSDKNCLAKKFIAFKTAQQLKVHKYQIHDHVGSKKIDGRQLCNFHYEGHENEAQLIQIKDNEGINMENEFLALKKAKIRALGEADMQEDTVIDIRNFYPSGLEEDEHFKQAFIVKHKKQSNQEQEQPKKKQGKKKYVEKADLQKQKPVLAKQNEVFYAEDLHLLNSLHFSKLHYDDFEDKLADLLNSDDLKKIETSRNKFSRRNLTAQELITIFMNAMKKVSLRNGYEIFPHFIRTIQNQNLKRELDEEYIKMLKRVKSKNKSILSNSEKYSQLFHKLVQQIQANLQTRIIQGSLSIKRPIRREKQRLYQIIGVLRRLKTQEMVKLKFSNNFGVEGDTIDLVHDKIFKINQDKVPSKLQKIPNEQIIDLYVFVQYCHEAILHSENMHLAKNKINQNILEDFLFDRPYLFEKYGIKKEQLKTLEEQVQYQKQIEERNHKKKLKEIEEKNKNMGYHSKANFNLQDKGDFPELMPKKQKTQDSRQNFKDVIGSVKQKPATYQKKINELFPTLGNAEQNNEPIVQKKQEIIIEKKEKAWWQKVNEKKVEVEEVQEVKVRKGKNKKEKWVAVKGLFN